MPELIEAEAWRFAVPMRASNTEITGGWKVSPR